MSKLRASSSGRASRPAVGSRGRTSAIVLTSEALARARTVALGEEDGASVASIMRALPDPAELPPGALVVVPAALARAPSLARSVLAVFGRAKTVSRARRCSALVARGYVHVGAAEDDKHVDVAWGYAPQAPSED
jgi:hypothetical protein